MRDHSVAHNRPDHGPFVLYEAVKPEGGLPWDLLTTGQRDIYRAIWKHAVKLTTAKGLIYCHRCCDLITDDMELVDGWAYCETCADGLASVVAGREWEARADHRSER